MNDFLTHAKHLDPTCESEALALAEHARMRVHDALCDVSRVPRGALQIRQALIDDLMEAPPACLPVALAELHAVAAFLFGSNDSARRGFRRSGVESDFMLEELSWLSFNPYRYAAGGLCDYAGATVEHLAAVFGLAAVMVACWPARDAGCPVCNYLDDHMSDEPLLDCASQTLT